MRSNETLAACATAVANPVDQLTSRERSDFLRPAYISLLPTNGVLAGWPTARHVSIPLTREAPVPSCSEEQMRSERDQ